MIRDEAMPEVYDGTARRFPNQETLIDFDAKRRNRATRFCSVLIQLPSSSAQGKLAGILGNSRAADGKNPDEKMFICEGQAITGDLGLAFQQ